MRTQAALIVVAEDDAPLRTMIVDALTDEGFEIIKVGHAAEAILHLEKTWQNVRVLFTDVHMPGEMDGLGLAHHVRTHWPRIGIIVTSGLAAPGSYELPHGSRFVPKPYQVSQVLAHIRELVADERPAVT